MLPSALKPADFAAYPFEARRLAVDHLRVLQALPLSFLPSLLREVAEYDFKFPIERRGLEKELAYLESLAAEKRTREFDEFSRIRISQDLENSDWASAPAQFVEQLSAYLWTTHQLDAFREAALSYAESLRAAVPPEMPAIPRLGVAVIGKDVDAYDEPMFRKLRPQGALYTNIDPANGLLQLLQAAATRAKANPGAYAHWYIDGDTPADHDSALTCISYGGTGSLREAILRKMQTDINKPGMGPEKLRTLMSQMRPEDLGLEVPSDLRLQRFEIKLLTEGSGTQIYSTSYAQWAAREVLRRAQPLTMLVRFAPRQRQRSMNELLSVNSPSAGLDPVGSLIDGDMGAYYNWLNQQRLPGSERSSFLVWFEGHKQALAIGPALPRGTSSSSTANLAQILAWAS